MKHGFIKVAAATPKITVASCKDNVSEILRLVGEAQEMGVKAVVFPELCITGSSCGDLFFTKTLMSAANSALCTLLEGTKSIDTIIIIGFPLVVNDKLYNCAAFCQKGQLLGVVPKCVLSGNDTRYFSTYTGDTKQICVCGCSVPFGVRLTLRCKNIPELVIGAEIGDEAFAVVPPSVGAVASGATVIVNPFSGVETVGAEEYRRAMISAQSARLMCGYIHAESGEGESTTDGVYGGHRIIVELGKILAETKPLTSDGLTVSELDLEVITGERRRMGMNVPPTEYTTVFFELDECEATLTRRISPAPFIPQCGKERTARCEKILTLQAKGLAQRIVKAYAKKCVIGISGGLDSCLAILVAARALDILGRPRTDILGVTMPCFGTTKRTKSNAELLCSALGAELRCVNIGESVRQHFADIGHDESNHNVVYENAQARERTQVIMDIANMENGIVVGTGDLSELALGWATYNGDHMSMYGVNGGIPKTLIRYVVAHCADTADKNGQADLAEVLRDILDTPVSPELLPADKDGNIAQKTEDLVGPYEIHDFYIYNMLRYGFAPDKLYRIAKVALGDKYSDEELLKWLKNLVRRFFAQQFKRSCLPDGPKIGTVGLSPRGDLLMPSDASCAAWLDVIDTL